MDEMEIVDKQGRVRYVVDQDNAVHSPNTCEHRYCHGICVICHEQEKEEK